MQIRAILCVLGGAFYTNIALAQPGLLDQQDFVSKDTVLSQTSFDFAAKRLGFLEETGTPTLDFAPLLAESWSADVQISIKPESDLRSQALGLRVRLDEMDQRDNGARNGWYVFLGTDNEALTWSGVTITGMELRDHATVGDVHFGLSFPTVGGQASFGYARRNVSYSSRTLSADVEEDMVGLSYGYSF